MKLKVKQFISGLMTAAMVFTMLNVSVYAGDSEDDSAVDTMEVVYVDVSDETSTGDGKYEFVDTNGKSILFKDSDVIYELTGTTDRYLAFWIPDEPTQYHLRLNNVTVNGGLTNGSESGSTYVDVEVPAGTVNYLSEIKANNLTIHGSGTIKTTYFIINKKPAGGKLSSALHITDTTIVVDTKEEGERNCWEGTIVLDGNANVTMTGNDIYSVLAVGQDKNEPASVTLRDNASLKCLQKNMHTSYENIVDGIQFFDNSSLSLEDNSYLEAEGKSSTNVYGQGYAIVSEWNVAVADQAKMKLKAYGVALGTTGGSVILNGGTIEAESYGDNNAIYAGRDLEVDGGTLNATTDWYSAIYTDGEILIQNNAEVTAKGGNDTIWGVSGVTIQDSTVTSTSTKSTTAIAGGNFSESTGDVLIEGSIIKVNAVGPYSIRGAGDLTIKNSWVESFDGEVDHTSGRTTWENMVSFQDNEGTVIGDPSLPGDVEMTEDMTLTIPEGTSLTVPDEYTLTNKGAITNTEGINNNGEISNEGTITNKALAIALPESLTLKAGNSQSLTDYVTYGTITGNEVAENAPVNETLNWASDDEDVASVKDGTVTAKYAGTAVITASTGDLSDECTVTVEKKETTSSGSSYSLPESSSKDDEDDDNKEDEGLEDTENTPGSETAGNTGDTEGTAIPADGYSDVGIFDWYYEGVTYSSENGIMSGMGDGTFAPNTTLSREMMGTILWNMAGKPEANDVAPFLDVTSDKYYAEAIAWANENGIVSGYGDTFGVSQPITREQFAVMLYNYAVFKGYDTTQGGMAIREFTDFEKISDYAVTAMTWAVNNGIIGGYEDGSLRPQGGATRAEAAAMLMNFYKKVK